MRGSKVRETLVPNRALASGVEADGLAVCRETIQKTASPC